MDLLHKLPKFLDLVNQYSDDLIGFVSLLKGSDYSMSHREISFFCCVKHPGSRVQDPAMHEYSSIVSLWFLLFRPKSIYLHVTPSSKKTKLFIESIKILIVVLKATKYAWITDFIEIRGNDVVIKGYDDWFISAKNGIKPENLAGFRSNSDYMVWLDDHAKLSKPTTDVLKGTMMKLTDRMVLA